MCDECYYSNDLGICAKLNRCCECEAFYCPHFENADAVNNEYSREAYEELLFEMKHEGWIL